MQKRYTQRTAALQATTVDAREVDTKKLKVSGKDITELIGQSSGGVKRIRVAEDTREVITQNDIWNSYVEQGQNGQVIIHTKDKIDFIPTTNEYGEQQAWNQNITKVYNKKAYIGNDFYANIKTGKIKNGSYMFMYNINLESFNSDLDNLEVAGRMFQGCSNLKKFNTHLSSLKEGQEMFSNCMQLTTFESDLSSLTNGYNMFSYCPNLTTFKSDLSSLKDGECMFTSCANLTTFESDLSSLERGVSMFEANSNLTTFKSDLSSLVNGYIMFSGCENLTTFEEDLNSLKDGSGMFYYTPIENFTSSLPSLLSGIAMFGGSDVALTRESLEYIADSINDLAEKGLATKTQDNYWLYSEEYQDENWRIILQYISPEFRGILSLGIISEDNLDLCQEIANKGWTVLINGSQGIVSPTQSTSLDDQVTVTPKPYYAKPVLSDEKRGRYINANGEYFNIIGGNTIIGADLSSFGMFTSLQDAIANMGLSKVEKTSTKKK